MTQYTLKTSESEANDIVKGLKSFVFRDSKFNIGFGDMLGFQVYKGARPIDHKIGNKKFRVTYVNDDEPIELGWKVIGFKEV